MKVALNFGDVVFDNQAPFVFIGGPCVIESRDHALLMADRIRRVCERAGVKMVYKSSYDKANRTSISSFRGIGMDTGLDILAEVRDKVGVPVTADVHSPQEAEMSGAVLDIVQIPAFLCRQTDLLIAAADTGKAVNVKKGQFMAPWDMVNVVEKIISRGNHRVLLTERGASFGYNHLIVDMAAICEMAKTGQPVVFDAGHSTQRPGGLGHASGGDQDLIPSLARAAVAVGVSAVFLEVHDNPAAAPCDGPNMWPLDRLEDLLRSLRRIDEIVKGR